MLFHYLKITFRNLRKYKTQNIISIAGLAAGFVCFSLSTIWIRYETSFDNFHPKADRIYLVQNHPRRWDTQNADSSKTENQISYPLAMYLKSNFPELEEVCPVGNNSKVIMEKGINIINVDSSFFKIFDIPTPPVSFFEKGSMKQVIVSEDFTETEYLKNELSYEIQYKIQPWPKNTNIRFQVLCPLWINVPENTLTCQMCKAFKTFVLLKKGVNVQELEKKLDKIITGDEPFPYSLSLTPIKQLNHKDPDKKLKNGIKFSHIYIFSMSGLLVILCALFNHITLFVSQMQMRMREFALRRMNGSFNGQIIQLLYFEFLIVLFISLVSGLVLLTLCLPHFREYTAIGSSNFNIFIELLIYSFAVITFAFLAGLFPILHFRKRTLLSTIQQQHTHRNKNLFRKFSLSLQLIISIGLLFCSLVILKQMNFLINTDLGINRHNVASVYADCCPLNDPYYKDKLKQIPGIKDVLQVKSFFLRKIYTGSMFTGSYDTEMRSLTAFRTIEIENHFFDFFNIDIIEGEKFSNESNNNPTSNSIGNNNTRINRGNMVVNETMAKGFEGNIIGKEIGSYTVVGIARDFYITPTTKAEPAAMYYPDASRNIKFYDNRLNALAYKYEEGQRQQTQQAITQWMREEFPDSGEFNITFTYMEDVFADYFKSEKALLFLLSIVTSVCILIAIFGVYSLASLTCEQRRKEIAIRKISGAEVADIMNIFFKEYLVLLALSALVAFPAGYIIMKRWMESYVKQTSMEAWLFVLIFLIMFAVIVLTIVSMVWRATNREPAEVVKS